MKALQWLDKESFDKSPLSSFRWAYLVKGDVLWVPFSSIIVEKAVGSCNCVTLRAFSTFFHAGQDTASMFFRRAYAEFFGFTISHHHLP